MRLNVVLCACTIAVTLPGSVAPAVEFVRDGQPIATIVVPDPAWEVVDKAALELQHHVELTSGAKLGILTESKVPAKVTSAIYLGPTQAAERHGIDAKTLKPNGFIVKSDGDALFIIGGDAEGHWLNDDRAAGTLFGVYDLLDREFGVRWLWPGDAGTYVPRKSSIVIQGVNRSHNPQLIHTRLRHRVGDGTGWSNPAARERYLDAELVWLRRNRFGRSISLGYDHGFTNYWSCYGKDHADYFNELPDGTRRPDPTWYKGASSLVSMCVSNPALHQRIVTEWLTHRTTEEPWLDCAENDTGGKCVCSKCLSWDVPSSDRSLEQARRLFGTKNPSDNCRIDQRWYHHLGSLSDRYAKFYLAVQKRAEQDDSTATVIGYAYANYAEPPVTTKLNDRIVIAIVPKLAYPWTQEKRDRFHAQWQGWADTGARLYLRPNYMLDGHNMPVFFADQLADDFRFAHERGMFATDFDSLTGQWATQGPNLYVLARVHQRPELSADEMLDEYYGAFGPARQQVRAYFEHWRCVSASATDAVYREAERRGIEDADAWNMFYRVAPAIFTPAVLNEGRRLLQKAAVAAESDSDAKNRVEFLEKGLHHAELTLAAQLRFEQFNRTGHVDGFKEALKSLDAFRASVENDFVSNMAFVRWAEDNLWKRK